MPADNPIESRRATYADLEAAPPHLIAEIIDGQLVTSRHLGPREGIAANVLACEIERACGRQSAGSGPWTFLRKPEVHFRSDVLVPDLAGWKSLRSLPEAWPDMPISDWICEVLSPATEVYDRSSKRRIYAAAGVKHLWLLDSRTKLLETFALISGAWMLLETFGETDRVVAAPLEALSFDLNELWPLEGAGSTTSHGVN